MKTYFSLFLLFFSLFELQAQSKENQYESLTRILQTYFSSTNSSSSFLNSQSGDFLKAERTFVVKKDTLWIYLFDPKDALTAEPKRDTSFVDLTNVEKLEINSGNSIFSSKGIGLKFIRRSYRTINSKITGRSSAKNVELSEKEISQLQGANITQKLAGQASGVFVGGSGTPGTSTVVRIRGIGSINANSPLFIVDDVPISQSNINTINPEDISSVQVLKDASSTALYGVRGANGVVVIKTKKGNHSSNEIIPLPNSDVELWIWGQDVERFNLDKVKKKLYFLFN